MSITPAMSRSSVHHGNLRAALVEMAVADLRKQRHEDISFRDLAMRIGVSHNAPYRHFANREEFLRALADHGLSQLREDYLQAAQSAGTAADRLRAACRAYIQFARNNRGMFRLIFQTDVDMLPAPQTVAAPGSAFAIFEQLVAEVAGAGNAREARLSALTIWSLLHGFASLELQGGLVRFIATDALEDVVVKAATRFSIAD